MSIPRKIESWLRCLPWYRRGARDADLERELRDHLDLEAEEQQAAGLSPKQASYAAHRALGNTLKIEEDVRAAWGLHWLETLAQDMRYALRMLRKSAGFTAVAVLTLALGIGANTAIFSVVEWLTLRPLPIHNPRQVVFLSFPTHGANFDNNFSGPEFREIQNQTQTVFSATSAAMFGSSSGAGPAALTVDGKSAPIATTYVSGDFFDLLGIQPYAGRFILPNEGKTVGADPVVVLSYRYWQSRFRGDLSIVGKPAMINGHPVTIIGIAPKGFYGVTPIMEMEAYLPLGMANIETGNSRFFSDPKTRMIFLVIGRLKSGLSIERANAQLRALGKSLIQQYPRRNESDALRAMQLKPPGIINGDNPIPKIGALFLLLAGMVLALACLNIANLLLVRAAARRREMGIRAALGAGRARLIRQVLTESLLLGIIGCAGGILAGFFAARAMSLTNFHTQQPIVLDFRFDWRVFAYATGIALLAGLLVGILPALRVSAGSLQSILHEGGRTASSGRQRLRRSLVSMQVAGSLTLLIVAGLFIRSLMSVAHANLGFDPAHVLNVTVDPAGAGYSEAQGSAFYRELLNRAQALPGVQSASLTWLVPLDDDYFGDAIIVPGYAPSPNTPPPSAGFDLVSPSYFNTMSIPILQGRDFSTQDNQIAPRVAIINQAMSQRLWPKQNPIGRSFATATDPKHPLTIIGVVQNSRVVDLYSPYDSFFYTPLAQGYQSFATLQIRSVAAPESQARAVESLIQSLAPAIPFYGVRTMTEALNNPNGLLLFNAGAVLTGSLGTLGLILAIVGVFGVMSYAVSLRTNEIGIRMALGAQPRQIVNMIGRQGLAIVAAGVAIGLFAAFGIGQLIGGLLVGITPTDTVTYLTVTALLAIAAVAACYIPARRAIKVDPMVALRYE